jgi:uncharacterized ion transporter superfamily protein YfcC
MSTEQETKTQDKKKKKGGGLSAFSILFIILIVLAIITMIMAASGVEGIEGATLANITTAPILGFADAVPVCLFVLILGGFLGIVTETGALDTGIKVLVHKLGGKELVLIPILMFLFSIGGTTYGMWEETVPFYLLLAATMVAAGYDSLVGAAIVVAGAGCGVLGSTVNPFAVGAAVDALSGTGLEINQGIIIGLGVVLWLVSLTISCIYIIRYAKRVKKHPETSKLSGDELVEMHEAFDQGVDSDIVDAEGNAIAADDVPKLTGKQKATLIVFALTFVIMIIGFIPWEDLGVDFFNAGAESVEVTQTIDGDAISEVYDESTGNTLEFADAVEGTETSEVAVSDGWSSFLVGLPLGQWYFDEASAWFLIMAIIIGFVVWMGEGKFVKVFIQGASDMMSVVLIIAVARSITVLMGETGLDVWILDAAANGLAGVAGFIFAPLSFLLFLLLSFLIPSSSGMATVSMPIMGPLAAELGFSVEVMIMIFVAGNGLINLITPTAGALMGGLQMAKISYSSWIKFFLKLFVILAVVCCVILTVAMLMIPMTT